jgi:beta-glucosidase
VWFGGSEAGGAIADVLFGDVNPSGKLTTTFPQNTGQLPMYYAQKSTGRPMGKWFQKFQSGYLDVSNDPVYPFGFGLSYTEFEYGEPQLNKNEMTAADSVVVSIEVTNKGKRDGREVVQLYIHDVVGSITRPVKELKGFQKVALKAGETKKINFTIRNADLSFYNYDLSFGSEPGKFELLIGPNSRDVKKVDLELK